MRLRVHTEPPVERRAFGAAVRELRGRRGLSLGELGARAQVHDGYLRAVERAEVEPGLRTMGRIAAALELPLSTLMVCAERRLWEAAGGGRARGGSVGGHGADGRGVGGHGVGGHGAGGHGAGGHGADGREPRAGPG